MGAWALGDRCGASDSLSFCKSAGRPRFGEAGRPAWQAGAVAIGARLDRPSRSARADGFDFHRSLEGRRAVSGGRETVLSSLRRALGVTGDDTVRRAGVAARLEGAGAGGPSLALGRLSGDAAVQAFVTRAQGLSASVEHVAEIEGLGSAAARVIRRLGLPPRVVMASDPLLLRGMSGFAVQGIATRSGAAEAAD